MTNLQQTIDLLNTYGVNRATGIGDVKSTVIHANSLNKYYVTKFANGIDVIYLTDDVDVAGVFEEQRPACSVYSSTFSDGVGKPSYFVRVIEF